MLHKSLQYINYLKHQLKITDNLRFVTITQEIDKIYSEIEQNPDEAYKKKFIFIKKFGDELKKQKLENFMKNIFPNYSKNRNIILQKVFLNDEQS